MYTREDLESMPARERPSVRVVFDCDFVDEDGRRTSSRRNTTGRILVDGNNPWVEIYASGRSIAERFSWGLICQVLNDRFESPIHFWTRVEYEV